MQNKKTLLDRIQRTGDIRLIPPARYSELAREIREFLIEKVSSTGGHLASNLGVVELTMALHLAFDFRKDKIIWDVGHQSYVHKILTGRKEKFDTLRQYGGLSGFPKKYESETDCFDTGHSANSVSAGLGMVYARDRKNKDYSVISVIGDGSSTGGEFYEALNNLGRLNSNYIIILNDNEMSISPNQSGLSVYLSSMRTATSYHDLKLQIKKKLGRVPRVGEPMVSGISNVKEGIKNMLLPEMMFENFGVTYLGPIDGHNVGQLTKTLQDAKRMNKAVLVHVVTRKGKGYPPAEHHPDRFHGIGPFDPKTGRTKKSTVPTWTDVFSSALLEEAECCKELTAVTAAMADGTGLKQFALQHPGRFFDVGIAEEHAVTFAAGLAEGGLVPVVAMYSTFLQRAYDQVLEDVCLQNLHVIFAIDRAGIVGQDGETHQGVFDVSFLTEMPNLTVIAPKNALELKSALHHAIHDLNGPVAIRYGRGAASCAFENHNQTMKEHRSELLIDGSDATIFAVGAMNEVAGQICEELKTGYGVSCGLVNVRYLKPLDTKTLLKYAEKGPIITLEDNQKIGGFGQQAAACLQEHGVSTKTLILAVGDQFVTHGKPDVLMHALGLSKDTAVEKIASFLGINRI